jgi:aryl-alcohol dehydrogenase-like predicted oxidoreductase
MIHTSTSGFGTMELCISPDRPSLQDAQALLVAMVEQHGLTFIDTADAYAPSEQDFGYGEELCSIVAKRPGVTVATKGGFTRPNGTWTKNGDPDYLHSAIDSSLQQLGVEQIALYQFHTPDPRYPIESSLAPIVEARGAGKIAAVGVSNFTLEQLQVAVGMTKIATVQNSLSVLSYDPETHDPMLRYCEANDITFLAYAPFGGFRNRGTLSSIPEINAVADRAGLSVFAFALQFLNALSPAILPIPGTIDAAHAIENIAVARTPLPKEYFDEMMSAITAP